MDDNEVKAHGIWAIVALMLLVACTLVSIRGCEVTQAHYFDDARACASAHGSFIRGDCIVKGNH